jgi:uncharacterized integral membrane protein
MEFLIVVIGGILIIGAVIEATKIINRYLEHRRESYLERTRYQRWLREEENKGQR